MNADLARVNKTNCSLNNFSRVAAVFCQQRITVSYSIKYKNIYLGDTGSCHWGRMLCVEGDSYKLFQ